MRPRGGCPTLPNKANEGGGEGHVRLCGQEPVGNPINTCVSPHDGAGAGGRPGRAGPGCVRVVCALCARCVRVVYGLCAGCVRAVCGLCAGCASVVCAGSMWPNKCFSFQSPCKMRSSEFRQGRHKLLPNTTLIQA